MAITGKAVVCTCGEIGVVVRTPRLKDEPSTIRHLHGREHKVFAMWSPWLLEINDDGYYEGGRR